MQTALLMRFSAGLFSVAPTTCGLHDFAQNDAASYNGNWCVGIFYSVIPQCGATYY